MSISQSYIQFGPIEAGLFFNSLRRICAPTQLIIGNRISQSIQKNTIIP